MITEQCSCGATFQGNLGRATEHAAHMEFQRRHKYCESHGSHDGWRYIIFQGALIRAKNTARPQCVALDHIPDELFKDIQPCK